MLSGRTYCTVGAAIALLYVRRYGMISKEHVGQSAAAGLLLRPRPHDRERFPFRLHGSLRQLLGWITIGAGAGGGRGEGSS